MNYKRNEYPVNEPVFPNLENCGLEIEEAIDREFEDIHGNYRRNQLKREKLPTITKEWTNKWMYMMFKYATDVDEDRRICKECFPPGAEAQLERDENSFTKGHLVIREQFSVQDFDTLHIQCAMNKLIRIRDNIQEGIDKFESIVNNLQSKGVTIR